MNGTQEDCPRRALLHERFWAQVSKGEPDECWPWTGHRPGGRYGSVSAFGVKAATHRLSYELHVGPIPGGMHVLHTCDNPPCCNPAHLFLGTQRTNMADKTAKGRQARGERQWAAKLTVDAVLAIRARHAAGERVCDLAAEFGVQSPTVCKVVRRENWKHVPATDSRRTK